MSRRSDEFTLTEAEVRGVVRLLAEALTPDDGRPAKVRRLCNGLARMIGADGWLCLRTRVAPGRPPVNIDFVYGGDMGSEQLAAWSARSLESAGRPVEHPAMDRLLAAGRPFTATRPQLVADEAWDADPTRPPMRRAGLDELMYAWVPIERDQRGTLLSGGCLLRHTGRSAFNPRDAAITHLIFQESSGLHAAELPGEVEPLAESLTPRQRVVLAQLIDGCSARQIAANLGLSLHTANDHIKAIYKHFEVQSRAELMRRFMQVNPGVGDVA